MDITGTDGRRRFAKKKTRFIFIDEISSSAGRLQQRLKGRMLRSAVAVAADQFSCGCDSEIGTSVLSSLPRPGAPYPRNLSVSLSVSRPSLGFEVLTMSQSSWIDRKGGAIFFPDSTGCNRWEGDNGRGTTDFPLSGVTVICKWQGHFVIANGHREMWILSHEDIRTIDLGFFGPEWLGCTATLVRDR